MLYQKTIGKLKILEFCSICNCATSIYNGHKYNMEVEHHGNWCKIERNVR